jgi:SAM-dependent methyltransferase
MTTTQREKDIEPFDQWSSTYEDSWMQRAFFDQAHQATLALAAGIVHQPASVFDVGCGTGKLLRQARTYWPEAQLIGVDPANGMIEMAKRLTPNATFFTGMAEALPLQDALVDPAVLATSDIRSKTRGKTAVCGTISPPPLCVYDEEKEMAEPSVMFIIGTDLRCSQHRVPFPTGSFMSFFSSRFFSPGVG